MPIKATIPTHRAVEKVRRNMQPAQAKKRKRKSNKLPEDHDDAAPAFDAATKQSIEVSEAKT
jgi:hypothetical protein